MTKVAIKNENITSFGGIYHIMDVFSKLGFETLTESVLGKRGSSDKICRTCPNTCTTYYGGCCLQFILNARDNCVQCSQVKENWTQR